MDARCQPNGEELGLIRTIGLNRLKINDARHARADSMRASVRVLGFLFYRLSPGEWVSGSMTFVISSHGTHIHGMRNRPGFNCS
jgi:hypothetical protein